MKAGGGINIVQEVGKILHFFQSGTGIEYQIKGDIDALPGYK